MRASGLNHADGRGDLTKEEFDAYDRAIKDGAVSMFDTDKICELTKLEEKDVKYIQSNYSRLYAKFYPEEVNE